MAPSSSARSPLFRTLHIHLSEAGLSVGDLRGLGWFDFCNLDAPGQDSTARFAGRAFLYLSVRSKRWNEDYRVLDGILSFLMAETSRDLRQTEIEKGLRPLLEVVPIDESAVLRWFERI